MRLMNEHSKKRVRFIKRGKVVLVYFDGNICVSEKKRGQKKDMSDLADARASFRRIFLTTITTTLPVFH